MTTQVTANTPEEVFIESVPDIPRFWLWIIRHMPFTVEFRHRIQVEILCPDCTIEDEKAGKSRPWGRRTARNNACVTCGSRSWIPAGGWGGYAQHRRIKELRTEMRKVTSGE